MAEDERVQAESPVLATNERLRLAAADNVLATMVEPFEGDGVALLQLVYKDPRQPLSIRMNAASLAAKYERPTAVIMNEAPSDMAPEAVYFRIRELMQGSCRGRR